MGHDWPVKKAIVDLPVKMNGNSKCTSCYLLRPIGAQEKYLSPASQMFLTEVKLHLQYRLQN